MRSTPGKNIVVWALDTASLGDATAATLHATLADVERAAVARHLRPEQRCGAAIVRVLAKSLLYAETGVATREWLLENDVGGVPFARAAGDRRPPRISLARTRGAVAAALSQAGAVGVDVERIDAADDGMGVARALFARVDRATIRGAADRADAFTRIWTVKEAVLKALGTGFALPPSHVGVLSLDPLGIGMAPRYALAHDWSIRSAARGPFRIAAACQDGTGDAAIAIRWMRLASADPVVFEPDP